MKQWKWFVLIGFWGINDGRKWLQIWWLAGLIAVVACDIIKNIGKRDTPSLDHTFCDEPSHENMNLYKTWWCEI